jgi:hypothetical protein
VILKKLPVSSQRVSLSHGGLKFEKGVYCFAWAVHLKNTGSGTDGTITTWLTVKTSHLDSGEIIPLSQSIESFPLPWKV